MEKRQCLPLGNENEKPHFPVKGKWGNVDAIATKISVKMIETSFLNFSEIDLLWFLESSSSA